VSTVEWLNALGRGNLPTGWRLTSVGSRYEVQLGKMLNADRAAEPGAPGASPYLRNVNVQWGRVDTDDLNWMHFGPEDRAKFALRRGDLLVCEGGEIGRCAIWESDRDDCFFQKAIMRVRPRAADSVAWLALCLRALALSGALSAGTDKSTIDHLPAEKLRALRVPLPDPDTQHEVLQALQAQTERLDATTEQRLRQAQLLTERRASLIFAAVSGKLGTQTARQRSTVPWVDTLPAHWSETKLTRVARLGSGHTPSRSRPEWWVDCTIPWITTGEVAQIRDDRREVLTETRENISELGLANSSAEVRPAGTVVLCRTAASAGYSAIMGSDMATSQDFATWTCSAVLLPRWLLFCLRAMRSDLLGRLAMGSTHRTIYFPDIESIRIPLPPVTEQQKMLDLADEQLSVMGPLEKAIERQVKLLRERRQALLIEAVTGRMQVPEVPMANAAA
jgi:type I restriction enzyme S subunit